MDWRVIVFLCLEALFGLWLLRRAGLLDTRRRLVISVQLMAAALVLRGFCLDTVTTDYEWFLSQWVAFYRENGGWSSFSHSLGNYNIPYLYFLCLFSYSSIYDLYLIKLLSIFFDILLAWSAMKLLSLLRSGKPLLLACFFSVLLLPTVVLNGALWGQCDSIYAALALMGLWLVLEDRPVLSMLCFSLAFGFKLQAIFLLPIVAVLLLKGKYRLWHLLLFPAFYILLVLPGVLLGKPFLDTLTLYASQTGTIGDGLNYNSPSVYSFFRGGFSEKDAADLGIVAAFTYMLALLLFCLFRFRRLDTRGILAVSLLLVVGIPFLLPHMHDRYFFLADLLALVFAFACPELCIVAPLAQFASLLGYHAYLKSRYLLYMDHGARALIAVLVLVFSFLLWQTALPPASGKTEISEKSA